MGFLEGKIDGERMFHGKVFPKTYFPPSTHQTATTDDLVGLVTEERAALRGALEQHGALLFRGFRLTSAEDFSRVVEAFGWDELAYEGAADRTKKAHRVMSTNESPVDHPIAFHHEMSLIKEPCSKVFFFCLEPSPVGGETSILPSDVVVERMVEELPAVMARFSEVGIVKVQRIRAVAAGGVDGNNNSSNNKATAGTKKHFWWQRMLKTDDEVEARKRALEKLSCNSVEFNGDGTVDFFYGPMHPVVEIRGRRVWFHTIQDYDFAERNITVSLGDGGPLPPGAVGVFDRILEENCVDVSWRKGDVLLLDNFRVQHARRPGKPPRCVLVSLCK